MASQVIRLCRALYQDCDIYLLDDPLSAVDAHVAAWLLQNAIQGSRMAHKTRILCTHNTQVHLCLSSSSSLAYEELLFSLQ